MDKVNLFMNKLKQNASTRNFPMMSVVFREGCEDLKNLPANIKGQVIATILNKNDGVINFLKETENEIGNKKIAFAVKDGLQFLECMLDNYNDFFDNYFEDVKVVCENVIIARSSLMVKKAACSLFNKIILFFKEYEMNLYNTICKFATVLHKFEVKDRSIIFSISGTIMKHCPDIPELDHYASKIYRHLQSDIKLQSIQQPPELEIYFDVITNILDVFPPNPKIRDGFLKDVYKQMKYLLCNDKEKQKMKMIRAAVKLFTTHSIMFHLYLLLDYKLWHTTLLNLSHSEIEDKEGDYERALQVFYRTMSSILIERHTEDDKKIFTYFKEYLEDQLSKESIPNEVLCNVIYGYSEMTPVYKYFHSLDAPRKMFLVLAHRTLTYCKREYLESNISENICDYQDALSKMVYHIDNLSMEEVYMLIQISIFIMKKYPYMSIKYQKKGVSSLWNTMLHIGTLNQSFLREYVHHFTYDGIIWSCSHPLHIDSELEKEWKQLPMQPISYKSYLFLWQEIINRSDFSVHREVYLTQFFCDKLMDVCSILIDELNLNIVEKDDVFLNDSTLAENEGDFKLFINVVDLYYDIIVDLDAPTIERSICRLLRFSVRKSYKYPTISGFYKLIRAIFKFYEIFQTSSHNIHNIYNIHNFNSISEWLIEYILNVIQLIPKLSNEVQLNALYMVLDTPYSFIAKMLNSVLPILKHTFTLGTNNLQIACYGLSSIMKWGIGRNAEDYLCEIMLYLEPYIKNKVYATRSTKSNNDVDSLNVFQNKIYLFFGSLFTDVMTNFIFNASLNVNISWNKSNLFKYDLLLKDIKVEILLEKIIQRVIMLTYNWENRATKTIACEVFHSLTVLLFGMTAQQLLSDKDRFLSVYKIVCPELLKLACHSDEIISQLCQPLAIELMRWFGSKFMQQTNISSYLIDLLFENLSNEAESVLKEFSGRCLAEFTAWTMKEFEEQMITNIENIKIIIRNIKYYALEPSKSKKIAASTAFNYLYIILSENHDIINIHWLEFLYCFVKSMKDCDDSSIQISIQHIEKVLQTNARLLMEHDNNRKKPIEFDNATLTDATNWLLIQCGSLNINCRNTCMELYDKFSDHSVDNDIITLYTRDLLKDVNDSKRLVKILQSDLEIELQSITDDVMLKVWRNLDCYNWLLQKDEMYFNLILTNTEYNIEPFLLYLRNVMELLIECNVSDLNEHVKLSYNLQNTKYRTTMSLLKFLELLTKRNEKMIYDFIYHESTFKLLTHCLLSSRKFGLEIRSIEMYNQYFSYIENILSQIIEKADLSSRETLKVILIQQIEKYSAPCFDLTKLVEENDTNLIILKQYLRGLSRLKKLEFHRNLLQDIEIFKNTESKIKDVFDYLIVRQSGTSVVSLLRSELLSHLKKLLDFYLVGYEQNKTEILMILIQNQEMLFGGYITSISHGEYFVSVFHSEIMFYMLQHIDKTVHIFIKFFSTTARSTLTFVEDLLRYTLKNQMKFQSSVKIFVHEIIKAFPRIESASRALIDKNQILINIYGLVVKMMDDPMEVGNISIEFYNWIQHQLTDSTSLEYKTKIIRNFLICLTDVTSTDQVSLLAILCGLRVHRLNSNADLSVSKNDPNVMESINCFHTLLNVLLKCKSVTVFKALIFYSAGAVSHLNTIDINTYLKEYFAELSNDDSLSSLQEAYKLFMTVSSSRNDRFDIMDKFLIPAMEFSAQEDVEEFFELNIATIYEIIQMPIPDTNSEEIRIHVISKIGSYKLISAMFTYVPISKIQDENSIITKNIIGEVNDGSGFLKKLFGNFRSVRSVKSPCAELNGITRLLHCAAYNCTIAYAIAVKNSKLNIFIFGENMNSNELIWKNIIDCTKKYNLKQNVADLREERKRMILIKNDMQNNYKNENHFYQSSFETLTFTLVENINAYDLNNRITYPMSDDYNASRSMEFIFEQDDLNNHECMATVCAALTNLASTETNYTCLPDWLKTFQTSVLAPHNDEDNICLFMLKVISNMQTIFKKFAKFFLLPLMKTIYSFLSRNSLNYIVTDALLLLIEWHNGATPTSNKEKDLAQKLIDMMIQKSFIGDYEDNKKIFKYNMNVIQLLIKLWSPILKTVTRKLSTISHLREIYLQIMFIYLINDVQLGIVNNEEVLKSLYDILNNWKADENVMIKCFKVFGLILYHLGLKPDTVKKKDDMLAKIQRILNDIEWNLPDRAVKCIYAMRNYYPRIIKDNFEFVIMNTMRITDQSKAYCLEIFLENLPVLDKPMIMNNIDFIGLTTILQKEIRVCEKLALEIIKFLITPLGSNEIISYIESILPYVEHESVEYRRLSYSIFMDVYKKYSCDISEDDTDTRKLTIISTKMLLTGLTDSSIELQDMILNFFLEEIELPLNSKDRFLKILEMYSPEVENVFLTLIPLAMLDLATKSEDVEKMLFEPFSNCNYKNYSVISTGTFRDYRYLAPTNVSSLAQKMNDFFSRNNCSFDAFTSYCRSRSITLQHEFDNKSLPTVDFQFEPCHNKFPSTPVWFLSGPKKRPQTLPQPAKNIKKLRNNVKIMENSDNSYSNRTKRGKISDRNKIRLCRKYRRGQFPDIEICAKDIVIPLRELVKNDGIICKDLSIMIISSLIENITMAEKSNDFFNLITKEFDNILKNCEGSGLFIHVILEVIYKNHMINCCTDNMIRIIKNNNLNCLGICILEQKLIYDEKDYEPPTKKSHVEGINDPMSNEWLRLATFYQSLIDTDVALNILETKISDKLLNTAAIKHKLNDYAAAKNYYFNAYITKPQKLKELCLQNTLECMRRLSNWAEIDEMANNILANDYNNIWHNENKHLLLSYLFKSSIFSMYETDTPGKFIDSVYSWLKEDSSKMAYIDQYFGGYLSVLRISNENENLDDCRTYTYVHLAEVSNRWMNISPFLVQRRLEEARIIRQCNDVSVCLALIHSIESLHTLNNLMDFWRTDRATVWPKNELVRRNEMIMNRLFFISKLIKRYKELPLEPEDSMPYIGVMKETAYNVRIQLINTALNQKNQIIAWKHIRIAESEVEDITNMPHSLILAGARGKYLKAELEVNNNRKLSFFVSAWKHFHRLLESSDLRDEINIATRQYISSTTTQLIQLCSIQPTFVNILRNNNEISSHVPWKMNDFNDMKINLINYGINRLKECCDLNAISKNENSYYNVAKYCFNHLSDVEKNISFYTEFLMCTLKAMQHGSVEAARYLPCLMKPDNLIDEKIKAIFIRECNGVQVWRFISWQDQMMSLLGTSLADLVKPTMKRLSMTYPNAILYTFHSAIDANPSLLKDHEINALSKVIYNNPSIENFLAAMQYVTQPELYLCHFLSNLKKHPNEEKQANFVDELIKSIYDPIFNATSDVKPGNVFKELIEFQDSIRVLPIMNKMERAKNIESIINRLKVNLRMRRPRSLLKDYSPWLVNYSEDGLEIPGQYTGKHEPLPQYHVKIRKFKPIVKIMPSLRKPIQIIMIGSDAKNYNFLVKFGEDLRSDQRIQQLFEIMNELFDSNLTTKQEQSSIFTYKVIPLSKSLGLIEWIENVRSLQNMIDFTLSKTEIDKNEEIRHDYMCFIQNAAPLKTEIEQYQAAFFRYSASDVLSKMNELIRRTKRDALRKTFIELSPSHDIFLAFRNHFTNGYAVMCIAHWLLGIGDRHLENILVDLNTGQPVGIDFDLAFDAAIDRTVPELMPFRLSPQIQYLLNPFTEYDLFSQKMISALNALQRDHILLTSCIGIFMQESLKLDKTVNEILENIESNTEETVWISEKKISLINQKFNGGNPLSIMVESLKGNHCDEFFEKYCNIINGEHDSKRAKMKSLKMSPNEQVLCLLDLATDLNVIGRSYHGWTPWL